jgi:hypothetical protein
MTIKSHRVLFSTYTQIPYTLTVDSALTAFGLGCIGVGLFAYGSATLKNMNSI